MKKVKIEEIFDILPYRNWFILGYVNNALSQVIPTLFTFMIVDEIEHMKNLVEQRYVI